MCFAVPWFIRCVALSATSRWLTGRSPGYGVEWARGNFGWGTVEEPWLHEEPSRLWHEGGLTAQIDRCYDGWGAPLEPHIAHPAHACTRFGWPVLVPRDTCYATKVLWHNTEQAPIFGTNLKVRLRGLDAPEMRSSCDLERCLAQRAKEVLEAFIAEQGHGTLRLEECVRDKYFRLTCDIVRRTGERAVDMMLRSGLAVKYDGQAKVHDWCIGAGASVGAQGYMDACLRKRRWG